MLASMLLGSLAACKFAGLYEINSSNNTISSIPIDLVLLDIEGNAITLREILGDGKQLNILFFSPFCPKCLDAMGSRERSDENDFALPRDRIGVSWVSVTYLREWRKAFRSGLPVYHMPRDQFHGLGVYKVPFQITIDKKGQVLSRQGFRRKESEVATMEPIGQRTDER